MQFPTNNDIHASAVDDVTFSRRGLGKRLLLGASAVAVLLAAGKRDDAQAAPNTPWVLGGNSAVLANGTEFLGTRNVAPLIFKTAATNNAPVERMRITPTGNVGIGMTAPSAKLQVYSTTYAIYARHTAASGSQPAVHGETAATAAGATGVLGKVTSTTAGADSAGVRGVNNGTAYNSAGVRGTHAGFGNGVHGTSADGRGVSGEGYTGIYGSGDAYGVLADATEYGGGVGLRSEGRSCGVTAISYDDGAWNIGVSGNGNGTDAIGVKGVANKGTQATAIWGVSSTGWAGYFTGKVHVTGTLSKPAGSFMIDHPLDPENKNLYHSFVESPDMMNFYNGNVTLDGKGEATVEMPDWFEALNRDFRYQLTAIGAPGPNLYVAEEITTNHFKIGGGNPGIKVSWQVTGIRQDAYANANRIPVEEDKPTEHRGKYLHPKEHGKPESAGVDAERINKGREKNPKHERPAQGPQHTPPQNQ